MRVFYAEANYGQDEIDAALEVLKNSRLALMDGPAVKRLQKDVARLFDKTHGLMTNSGSSANLLATIGMNLPKGSKVVTPALTFSTTVSPLVQMGLVPVFVDVDPDTLQMDPAQLPKLDLEGVRAICVPNLIGNVADWAAIRSFADEHDLLVFEDSADTIGYTIDGQIKNYSDVATTSFYASHVVTGAGCGGMVCFNDEAMLNRARSFRGWGRRSSQYGETEEYERRFSCQVDGMDYDDKYVFDDLGYNLIASDVSAAFAAVQVQKLSENVKQRWENFNYLKSALAGNSNYRTFDVYDGVYTGWLAFPIMVSGALEGRRKDLQIFLEQNGVQTRTVFTGNITRQPVAAKFTWDAPVPLTHSDKIMANGVLLGCHNQMTKEKMDYVLGLLAQFSDHA